MGVSYNPVVSGETKMPDTAEIDDILIRRKSKKWLNYFRLSIDDLFSMSQKF